jgi:16S rRNA (adenine1518-N6/adenine1519-N6)-dimethyltransferase
LKKFKPNNNLVKPKKKLGQHFLNSSEIAKKIVDCINYQNIDSIIEVGPGMGILTQHIIGLNKKSYFVEIDNESVTYLKENYALIKDSIIEKDFFKIRIK